MLIFSSGAKTKIHHGAKATIRPASIHIRCLRKFSLSVSMPKTGWKTTATMAMQVYTMPTSVESMPIFSVSHSESQGKQAPQQMKKKRNQMLESR